MAEPRPFLTAEWRYLAMLNYEVPPALLRALVPVGTELDTWDGATLASIVGFRFLDTRVLGIPIPGHRDFDEVMALDGALASPRSETRGRPTIPDPFSEAAFISEHYWGYTVQRDGGCKEYRVAHPQWRVWDSAGAQFDCDVSSVYGAGFAECLSVRPRSAFLAEGFMVTVYPGRRLAVAALR